MAACQTLNYGSLNNKHETKEGAQKNLFDISLQEVY